MKGNIEVESRPGRGSLFRVLLELNNAPQTPGEKPDNPYSGPEKPSPVEKKEIHPDHAFDPGKIKILVADDNPVNQKVAGIMLKRHGFSTATAGSGTQVIQQLKQASYDLILMDIQMPEMDGIQATKIIRDPESDIRCRQIPIIAMTAHATHEDEQRCLDAGMNAYLAKPVTGRELIAMIRKVLDNKKKRNCRNRSSA